MAAPYLHALSCSKCGAALSVASGQQILTCRYCAQAHVFVPPPPPERPGTLYTVGERVAVEWGGHWWPATLLSPVGALEWQVHFEGWDHHYDVVVGPSRIRHISQATRSSPAQKRPLVAVALAAGVLVLGAVAFIALRTQADSPVAATTGPGDRGARYRVGQAVDIYEGATWHPGRILQVAGERYLISYDGWSSTWNEWVEANRLRARTVTPLTTTPASGSYAVGDAVQIEWKGSWYPGRIVEVAGSSYKITYDGYSATWDEWVEASRLRRP